MLHLRRVASRGLSSSSSSSAAAASRGASKTAKVDLPGYELHLLDPSEGPSTVGVTSAEESLAQYRTLLYYRRIEETCFKLYQEKKIRGFCHLNDGQESITVGMDEALTKEDSIITAYRDHTIAMSRGVSGAQLIAEMFGRDASNPASRGKGGSMHYYNPAQNFYGGNGIVGAQVPVGAGVAFAHKARGEKNVCLALYGDGAANQGQIYEAANMAALWKLPLVFVTENNHFAMGTSTERHAASSEFYKRGNYVPGVRVNATDVLSVRNAVSWAKDYCTSGKGPLFMEFDTYRFRGHSMSDPGLSYRSNEDVADARANRDCVLLVRNRLLEKKWATEEELDEILKETNKQVKNDVKEATATPEPDLKELHSDIYVDGPLPFTRLVEYESSLRQ